MTNNPSLKSLFITLQGSMIANADFSKSLSHPSDKGDNTEASWITWFNSYLPNRYKAAKATIIDSKGQSSDQIDVVIYDGQYSYLAFNQNDILYLPAESVYAVFEVKQDLSKSHLEYTGEKASSVRRLYRTSTTIPFAAGVYPAKKPHRIISGILTTESSWKDCFGSSFKECVFSLSANHQIDCGCVLKAGSFFYDYESQVLKTSDSTESLVHFFLQFLILLQSIGTVPAIDLKEYLKALSIKEEVNGETK